MYPDRDTLSNVPRSGYITARDKSMLENGVTEGGKNTAIFCNLVSGGISSLFQVLLEPCQSQDFPFALILRPKTQQ